VQATPHPTADSQLEARPCDPQVNLDALLREEEEQRVLRLHQGLTELLQTKPYGADLLQIVRDRNWHRLVDLRLACEASQLCRGFAMNSPCRYCSKSFRQDQWHHRRKKPFDVRLRMTLHCAQCGAAYTRSNDLMLHLQTAHSVMWNKVFLPWPPDRGLFARALCPMWWCFSPGIAAGSHPSGTAETEKCEDNAGHCKALLTTWPVTTPSPVNFLATDDAQVPQRIWEEPAWFKRNVTCFWFCDCDVLDLFRVPNQGEPMSNDALSNLPCPSTVEPTTLLSMFRAED
ncbi:unnamed protein product, partial [Cladocopium goreaui]